MTFSENFACPEHGVSLPELEPRIFSFNSPHGACPRCTGLGAQLRDRPRPARPGPVALDRGGRARALVGRQLGFYESVVQAIAERYEIDLDTPWRDLTEEQQNYFLFGTGGERIYVTYRNRMGRRRQYTMAFEGSSRRCSGATGDRLAAAARADRGVHELPAVPDLHGARPEAGGARGHGRRALDPRLHEDVGRTLARVPGRPRADAQPRS
jgi:excinuclease UvrABC ATPase subunit